MFVGHYTTSTSGYVKKKKRRGIWRWDKPTMAPMRSKVQDDVEGDVRLRLQKHIMQTPQRSACHFKILLLLLLVLHTTGMGGVKLHILNAIIIIFFFKQRRNKRSREDKRI